MPSENVDNQSSIKKDKPEEKILNYFKILYNSVIILGVMLCILYFGFIIKTPPNISDISQIINYIITISGVALILIFLFSMIMLLPSILFSMDPKLFLSEKKEYNKLTIGLLLWLPFLAHIIFFTVLYMEIHDINKFLNENPNFFILYYLAFSISIFYFFTKKYIFSLSFSFLLFIIAQLSFLDFKDACTKDSGFYLYMLFILTCGLFFVFSNRKIFRQKLRFNKYIRDTIKKYGSIRWLIFFFDSVFFLCPLWWIIFKSDLNKISLLYGAVIVFIIFSSIFCFLRFKWLKDTISVYSIYTIYWFISFGFVVIYFLNYDTFQLQLLALFLTSIIIVLINTYAFEQNITLFKDNKISFTNFDYKKFVRYITLVIGTFLLLATILPLIYPSTSGSLIEKIFATSGFGHYSARLQFKEDYIKKSNPFLLNDSNQTINTFEILSNLGKEYIIKEKYPLKIVNKGIAQQDVNMSDKAQNIVFMNLCWDKYENIGQLDKTVTCGKDNEYDSTKYLKLTSTKQLFDSNSSGFFVYYGDNNRRYWYTNLCWDQNKTIGNLSETSNCHDEVKLKLTPKQNNSYIFRINKDNVINEMTGEEPNKQATMWVIN